MHPNRSVSVEKGPDTLENTKKTFGDGQVLVFHDLVGMTHEFHPRFLRRYLNLYEDITGAIGQYVADVKSVDFPNKDESYTS